MQSITVRRPQFEFPATIAPVFRREQPEWSYVATGLSMTFPYVEPYLIATLRAASRHVSGDDDLRADIQAFCGQEGQHFREHRAFNQVVRHAGSLEIADLEQTLAADYERFTARHSLRFNLAYAEGFEALTTALALYVAEQRLLGDDVDEPVGALWRWHLLEELEHRTVAFEAYRRVCGGYCYRVVVGAFAQWHLVRFVLRVTVSLERANPDVTAALGGRRARARRLRTILGSAARHLAPKVLRTYLPWYHPGRLMMPDAVRAWGVRYTEAAAERPT